jgi:hypothetical protein
MCVLCTKFTVRCHEAHSTVHFTAVLSFLIYRGETYTFKPMYPYSIPCCPQAGPYSKSMDKSSTPAMPLSTQVQSSWQAQGHPPLTSIADDQMTTNRAHNATKYFQAPGSSQVQSSRQAHPPLTGIADDNRQSTQCHHVLPGPRVPLGTPLLLLRLVFNGERGCRTAGREP